MAISAAEIALPLRSAQLLAMTSAFLAPPELHPTGLREGTMIAKASYQ